MKKYTTYDSYLASPEWKEKRLKILKRDGFICVNCGSAKNLRVHHIRYPDNLGEEDESDLITLCDNCHEKIHAADIAESQKKISQSRIIAEEAYFSLNESRLLALARKKATKRWIDETKMRDFLYGGNENMCKLDLLKESSRQFAEKNHCEPFGVSCLQVPLGFGHRMLVNELYGCGYTVEEICMVLPFKKDKVKKYLEGKDLYWDEENWSYMIPWQELQFKARQFVAEDQNRRREIDGET